MQGLSAKKQEKILSACKRNRENSMTHKETETEMMEAFKHKKALTEKINWNKRELMKIEAAYDEDPSNITLADKIKLGKKILSVQTTEQRKLTLGQLSNQLGMKEHVLRHRWLKFLGGTSERV